MSDKAQALIDELVSACIAFGREREPDWQTRIEKARCELVEYIEELEAALKNARELVGMTPPPAFPEWIPVSEQLPEDMQQVLSTDGKEIYLDFYAKWEGEVSSFCDGLSFTVTHWMPLPEPPIVYGKVCEE